MSCYECFVGAAFGGPHDILCYFKDCQRQPLQINIYTKLICAKLMAYIFDHNICILNRGAVKSFTHTFFFKSELLIKSDSGGV